MIAFRLRRRLRYIPIAVENSCSILLRYTANTLYCEWVSLAGCLLALGGKIQGPRRENTGANTYQELRCLVLKLGVSDPCRYTTGDV